MKPGYKTTEFWTTAATNALAFLAVVGVLSQSDAASLGGSITASIAAVGTLVTNAVVVVSYIKSRTQIKAGQ
jgi:hypothetical protein